MKWVKVSAIAGGVKRVTWVSPRRIISVLEPIGNQPGGIVIEGGGIFDIDPNDIPNILHDIAVAEEGEK